MAQTQSLEDIRQNIVDYVLANHPSDHGRDDLPLDQSLLELGILDSYGVVELVVFLEDTFGIAIDETEITKEKMGSINKMAHLVTTKQLARA